MSESALRWYEEGWRRKEDGTWTPVRLSEHTLRALAAALELSETELRSRCEGLSPGRRKRDALRLAAVFPSAHGDPFWAQITEGLRAALPAPWIIMTFVTAEDREAERQVLDQIAEIGADALVIAPAMPTTWPSNRALPGRAPIVVIDRRPEGEPPYDVDVLVPENRTAVMAATHRLLERGSVRNLACIAGPLALSSNRERFQAVRDALHCWDAALLERPDDWAPEMDKPDVRSAEHAMTALLLRPRDQVPDGVICLNGKMTVGALLALRAQGKRIPFDIRFVGYDDGLWDCGLGCADPPPSVVRQDPEHLGLAAGKCILYRRAGGRGPVPVRPEAARFEPFLGGLPSCDHCDEARGHGASLAAARIISENPD